MYDSAFPEVTLTNMYICNTSMEHKYENTYTHIHIPPKLRNYVSIRLKKKKVN